MVSIDTNNFFFGGLVVGLGAQIRAIGRVPSIEGENCFDLVFVTRSLLVDDERKINTAGAILSAIGPVV
jgi:hypothetical protein